MPQFKVLISESNSGTLYVEAKDADEAKEKAQQMIDDNEIPDGTTDDYTSGYQIDDVQEEEKPAEKAKYIDSLCRRDHHKECWDKDCQCECHKNKTNV